METKSLESPEIDTVDLNFEDINLADFEDFDFGDERTTVEGSSLMGMAPHEIARLVKLDVETLRARYPEELALTPAKARAKVLDALRRTANSPKASPLRAQARAVLKRFEGQAS